MKLHSTKDRSNTVSFKEALLKGLPDDNGLFVPDQIPKLSPDFVRNLEKYTFQEIAFEIAHAFIGDEIPASDLQDIITKAIDFPAPVVPIDEQKGILELFHGPSLAFKDFGARFMAGTMSWFLSRQNRETVILVATSGDTGGAVAYGFLNTPGIRVVILYPSGKVSKLQEKQLTTLGGNISALEVQGTFDDCQAMVKQAFLDQSLHAKLNLSSANSINIARLMPQSFYYAEAYKQVKHLNKPVVFSVPSGNFGNITAGLYATEMGIPIHHFIAATNANRVFPDYIDTGDFLAKPSVPTLSNAMDVGNPSNFYRILDLYGSTWNNVKEHISSYTISDKATLECMARVFCESGYTLDPHAAVGFLALERWQSTNPDTYGLVLETAHPAKFLDVMAQSGIADVAIPERLAILEHREKKAKLVSNHYADLKDHLVTM